QERHGVLGPQVPGSLECDRASPDPLAARQADPHELSQLCHEPIICTALQEPGRQHDLTPVERFTLQHGAPRPEHPGPSRGPAPAMSFHQGQVLKYRVHLTADLEFTAAGQSYPLKAAVTELVAMHVVGVASDGTATVKVVASHATGVINGTRLPPAARKPQKVSVEKIELDGRLTEADQKKRSVTGFDLVPTSDEVVSLRPDHPVKPGDSWTRDATATFPLASAGQLHLSEQITFVRYQKFHGTRAAVLQDHASI